MNEACEGLREELSLYAEGELDDAARASQIRLHLGGCPFCREWIAGYDAFSRAIAEAELDGRPLDPGFTDRVMASVRGVEARRRSLRLRSRYALSAAASILVLLGLGAGGLLWRDGGFPASGSPRQGGEGESLAGARASAFPGVSLTSGGRALAPASVRGEGALPQEGMLWVIGPEREVEVRTARDIEAMLYALIERDAAGDRAADSRDWLRLKAMVGADFGGAIDRRREFPLLMVPEQGGPDGAIAVRPVAFPVRIAENELAAPARIRLNSPRRRYRILWQGSDRLPEVLIQTLPAERSASPPAFRFGSPIPLEQN